MIFFFGLRKIPFWMLFFAKWVVVGWEDHNPFHFQNRPWLSYGIWKSLSHLFLFLSCHFQLFHGMGTSALYLFI